jgi:hypothetical protein
VTARQVVKEALIALSAEGKARLGKASPLFTSWCRASDVAVRAGVSVSTAKKYLDQLVHYQGFERHRFQGGRHGYRHVEK